MGAPMSIEHLRVAVYRRFAETGQAATVPELAHQFAVAEASIGPDFASSPPDGIWSSTTRTGS